MSTDYDTEMKLEQAVAQRLAKLRTMPVDTSRLERRLRAEVPPPLCPPQRWWTPLTKAAAILLLAAVSVGAWFGLAADQAMASPARMAEFHQRLVADPALAIQVDSIDAASAALGVLWPTAPELPRVPEAGEAAEPPEAHVMACCLKSIEDKMAACVLLRSEGVPVTMVVANASDMRLPRAPTITSEGMTYRVQSSGGVNMVMTQRDGRWVCLMAELPSETLIALAAKLRF